MAKTVFDKILDSTTGPKSYDWYRKKVNAMTTPGARALINQPALVLADEPTGSLDPSMGDQVADLFAQLNNQHDVTLVTVTHNMALANRMGRVYSLENGKLRQG